MVISGGVVVAAGLVVGGGGGIVAGAGVVDRGRGGRCSRTTPGPRVVVAAVVDAWAGAVVMCDVVHDAGGDE